MLTGEQRTAALRSTSIPDLIQASPGRIADMADYLMNRHRILFTGKATKSEVVEFLVEARNRIQAAQSDVEAASQRSVPADANSASL